MTASITFTVALLLNMIKFPISQAGNLLGKLALGLQAMHRISNFMMREDAHCCTSEDDNVHSDSEDTVLSIDNGKFVVGAPDTPDSGVQSGGFTLSGIDIKLNRGEVLAVVGPVASGKSSLIQGLLGDIQSSEDTSISMTSGSSLSYAAQSPFVLSTTVRENILFGSEYDADRYEKVLHAC